MLALGAQILHRSFPCPHQLADGLMRWVWNPDGREFAGAMQLGQGERVPPVGLDPLARALRDQRGRNHGTVMAERDNLSLQPIAGWSVDGSAVNHRRRTAAGGAWPACAPSPR